MVLVSTELDLYDIELKDHESCIRVPDGTWAQLARIDEGNLIRMRSNVRMFDDHLSYNAMAKAGAPRGRHGPGARIRSARKMAGDRGRLLSGYPAFCQYADHRRAIAKPTQHIIEDASAVRDLLWVA